VGGGLKKNERNEEKKFDNLKHKKKPGNYTTFARVITQNK
jgi:hypothetical protein